jgi:multidrug resistance efflux pump
MRDQDDESRDQTIEVDSTGLDPVKRSTWLLSILAISLFVWYVTSDRVAPWTDQARVQAWVVPIDAKISGYVKEVLVQQEQIVEAGEVLARIDPEPYQIAVARAEAALQIAGQDIGASTAAVDAAQAKLMEAKAKALEYEVQTKRILEVLKKGGISAAEADRAKAELAKARAQVESAKAELERAKQQLGKRGEDNPKIRDAIEALRQARIDLADTEIHAPTDGGVTNLKIYEGYYAQVGAPLLTFVSTDDVWIQANLRENSIANIRAGDSVDIALDAAPGRIFRGTVTSRGFAVQEPSGGAVGEAATIRSKGGWLRDAQRFPVLIRFDDDRAKGLRAVGGQADVQMYTEHSNALLNGLGWIWVRLMSWLSYVY